MIITLLSWKLNINRLKASLTIGTFRLYAYFVYITCVDLFLVAFVQLQIMKERKKVFLFLSSWNEVFRDETTFGWNNSLLVNESNLEAYFVDFLKYWKIFSLPLSLFCLSLPRPLSLPPFSLPLSLSPFSHPLSPHSLSLSSSLTLFISAYFFLFFLPLIVPLSFSQSHSLSLSHGKISPLSHPLSCSPSLSPANVQVSW